MFSHPKLGSDLSIESDRELGCDNILVISHLLIFIDCYKLQILNSEGLMMQIH